MQRDPVDTCLSCYIEPYTGWQNFAFELSDLAVYLTERTRLIAHWRRVVPAGAILDVHYEDLVANRAAVRGLWMKFSPLYV